MKCQYKDKKRHVFHPHILRRVNLLHLTYLFVRFHRKIEHRHCPRVASSSNVLRIRWTARNLRKVPEVFFVHSCSDGVKNERRRVPRWSVTARRDRIPCLQACHLSEVALRVQLVSHFFLAIALQVQCLAREPPNLLDLGRGGQLSRGEGDRTVHCSRRSAKCTRHESAI